MLATIAASLVALTGVSPCSPSDMAPASFDYRAFYEGGVTYITFRDAATRRVDAWHDHYAQATVAGALVTKMEAQPGKWHLLVVAEDRCGDSANTIPYLAKLADLADNLDLRIIRSDVGKEIMEAHRTPDGRAATPTIILLNDRFEEAGCFVERPSQLQKWFLDAQEKLETDDLYDQKYAWYDEDAGGETIREIVEMVAAAVAGESICR